MTRFAKHDPSKPTLCPLVSRRELLGQSRRARRRIFLLASAIWVIDHIFTIAQGGSVGLNLHGGGNSDRYTPIADNHGVVVEARPEYYGVVLCALAGQGPLLATTINAGSLNTSAYTVQNSTSQLSLIINNRDATQNLQFTATCPSEVQSATLQLLSGPSPSATCGRHDSSESRQR